jgi:hypothetical protein
MFSDAAQKYQSGYLIVRPRTHPGTIFPLVLYFQSATCHGSVILIPFNVLFPSVPSRCVPGPVSHTQTLGFQLGAATLDVKGIKQYHTLYPECGTGYSREADRAKALQKLNSPITRNCMIHEPTPKHYYDY